MTAPKEVMYNIEAAAEEYCKRILKVNTRSLSESQLIAMKETIRDYIAGATEFYKLGAEAFEEAAKKGGLK